MTTEEIERFKIIPRNDILIYLHQNSFLGNEIKIRDLYDRINKPNFVFYAIIDDLIRLKLIECKKYYSQFTDRNSFFPESLASAEIKLSPLGVDYVESRLFGFNLQKYDPRNQLDDIRFGKMDGHLPSLYKMSFNDFSKSCPYDTRTAYFLVTGIDYKENKEKKVFISYSWDCEEHKTWIKRLATDLNSHFKVEFDSNLKVGIDPSNYMKQNILSSDFVIVVFTPNYLLKVKSEIESGVKYEFSVIQENLFRKVSNGKYIPVLRSGSKEKSIPDLMQHAIYIDFTEDDKYHQNLREIINKIENLY